jgi:oligopeptide/dipeptide ABC transporter ATP-binding protein
MPSLQKGGPVMSKVLLECRNLKKFFNTPKGMLHAVDDISFKLYEGKTLGVVGESGCGKSTLGRTILGLLPATSGDVIFDGQDISCMKKSLWMPLRREMQIIFQDPYSSLDPRMTVSEAIAEPLKIHKMFKNKKDLENRVEEVMATVGLDRRYINTYPHEMDGGRRQRIGIAKALALNPRFIVCDEPVSALDVSIQAQVLNLMMDLKDDLGLTYMFVSHDLSVVRHISDDVMVLYLGKTVELAPSEELFKNPQHPYTKALLSAIPVPEISYKGKTMEPMKGEVTSPINPPPGCRFASRCPIAADICKAESPPLIETNPKHFVACHFVKGGCSILECKD